MNPDDVTPAAPPDADLIRMSVRDIVEVIIDRVRTRDAQVRETFVAVPIPGIAELIADLERRCSLPPPPPAELPCNCLIPQLEGNGIHSPSCDVFKTISIPPAGPGDADATRLALALRNLTRIKAGERQRAVYEFDDEEMDDFMYRMLENRYVADLKAVADDYPRLAARVESVEGELVASEIDKRFYRRQLNLEEAKVAEARSERDTARADVARLERELAGRTVPEKVQQAVDRWRKHQQRKDEADSPYYMGTFNQNDEAMLLLSRDMRILSDAFVLSLNAPPVEGK
jgi:hypothetical protein